MNDIMQGIADGIINTMLEKDTMIRMKLASYTTETYETAEMDECTKFALTRMIMDEEVDLFEITFTAYLIKEHGLNATQITELEEGHGEELMKEFISGKWNELVGEE